MNSTMMTPQASRPAPTNLFAFFQEEREIWVQNLSTTQLSMQFEVAPGHVAGVLVPILPYPICLTNEVPFEAIKKSIDFRKFITRTPPVMRLLTTEEADAFFAERAKRMNAFTTDAATGTKVPDVWAARAAAEEERKALTKKPDETGTVVGPNGQVTFAPPKTVLELQGYNIPHMGVSTTALASSGTVVPQGFVREATGGGAGAGLAAANLGQADVAASPVNPRVVDLCHQVSTQLEESMRMKPEPFFRALKQLEVALTLEDLQYIESFGTYKTVKNWARKLQAERFAGQEVEDGLPADF